MYSPDTTFCYLPLSLDQLGLREALGGSREGVSSGERPLIKTISTPRGCVYAALKVRCPLWAGDIACSGILVFWQQMASKMSNPSRWYGSFVSFLRPDDSAHRRKELRRESEDAVCGWCSRRWISKVGLHTFTLGDIPPRVSGCKVRPATSDAAKAPHTKLCSSHRWLRNASRADHSRARLYICPFYGQAAVALQFEHGADAMLLHCWHTQMLVHCC